MANGAYDSDGETWEQPNSPARDGMVQQAPPVPLSMPWVSHKRKLLQVPSRLRVPTSP